MRLRLRCFAMFALTCLLAVSGYAQTVTITGAVTNKNTGEGVPAVSVTIKGSTSGVFTDDKGNFKLTTNQKPPFTLVFSSVGYENQEASVTAGGQAINIGLLPSYKLGEEIVVSASRLAERILESPVSIERMGTTQIRNAATPNFYDAIANLKGVDMTASSINFKTISTRGFNGSGNLRFNQLIDGMDNQAPALNFAVGNIIGMTELDVDNVELLQGASSALYGSGGMNGTALMTSKNPFKYQGLSFQVKQGVNHVDHKQRGAAPYYDWALRWGKKVSDKFAFKISGQFSQGQDWQANDFTNLTRNNVFSTVKSGTRASDPNYDGVNVYGDEVSTNMQYIATLATSQIPGALQPVFAGVAAGLPTNATPAQFNAALGNLVGALTPFVGASNAQQLAQIFPFYLGVNRNYFGAQNVSRTGYDETTLVDYNAYNVKLTGGLYYKIRNDIEASLIAYWGMGTSVYTGADRYSLNNFKLGQYKAEVKARNWLVRAYTTQENSGDSYAGTITAIQMNRKWKADGSWFQQYIGTYAGARAQGAPDAVAHGAARNAADVGRPLPGSNLFQQYFNDVTSTPITNNGGLFADKSSLYHFEGQYNFSDVVKVAELLIGANYRIYSLNSAGTIFADHDPKFGTGTINISEYGGYLQVGKKLLNDRLKLTGSIRYDKNENFEGRFTPRITGLIKVAEDNNIRLSYQTAYRFPSTQDQWINLNTPSAKLVGALPIFDQVYGFNSKPLYTAESVAAFRGSFAAGAPNPTLLKGAKFESVKPESASSYEIGYRGVIKKKLLVDAYAYLSNYKNFLGRYAVARPVNNNPAELLNPSTTESFSFVSNFTTPIKAIGWGLGLQYQLPRNFVANANISGDQLHDVPNGTFTQFNAPKLRFNVGVGNPNVYKGIGFNAQYRWQDEIFWEGTFGTGIIPAYGSLDGMISYNFPKTKNILKLGASNVFNNYYRSAFGNPSVGGLYYVSFGYNVF
jgi:outer membrane receptor protein involved in Fe transport